MERKATSGIMLTLLAISILTLAFNIQPIKASPIEYQDLYSEATNIFVTNWFLNYGRQQFTLHSTITIDAVALYVVDWGIAWIGYDGDEIDLIVKDWSTQNILASGVFMDTTQTGWIYIDLNQGIQLQAEKTFEIEFTVPVGDPNYKTAVHFGTSDTNVGNTWTGNQWGPITFNMADHAFKLAKKMIPKIEGMIDFDPDTLNLRSKGRWITAYIQLPEGYNAADIDATSILLNGTISPVLDPKYGFVTDSSEYLVDHNNDGILERMVEFDRAKVMPLLTLCKVTLTITGKAKETPFEGSDTIKVIG